MVNLSEGQEKALQQPTDRPPSFFWPTETETRPYHWTAWRSKRGREEAAVTWWCSPLTGHSNWTRQCYRNNIKYRHANLRLCSCVVCLKRREAPLTEILLAVRTRSTSEPQSLRTLPTDLQVLQPNSPVNCRVKPGSRSREANCSASLDLTQINVHTRWKNSGSPLNTISWKRSENRNMLHYKPADGPWSSEWHLENRQDEII